MFAERLARLSGRRQQVVRARSGPFLSFLPSVSCSQPRARDHAIRHCKSAGRARLEEERRCLITTGAIRSDWAVRFPHLAITVVKRRFTPSKRCAHLPGIDSCQHGNSAASSFTAWDGRLQLHPQYRVSAHDLEAARQPSYVSSEYILLQVADPVSVCTPGKPRALRTARRIILAGTRQPAIRLATGPIRLTSCSVTNQPT